MTEYELKELIENTIKEVNHSDFRGEIGKVISIGDGIANITGLNGVTMEEVVIFSNGTKGIVMSMDAYSVTVLIVGSCLKICNGDEVRRTGERFFVSIGEKKNILNGYGEPIDGGKIVGKASYYREPPNICDISPVTEQVITGIKAIDWMFPIGWGQRQLIVGDRFTGKTSLCTDIMISLKDQPNTTSIYISIGQRINNISSVLRKLKSHNVENYMIVVAHSSSEATMRYMAPFTGIAIAEYLKERGEKVAIFFDDLNQHAESYREISLIMKRPPGREAFPGDIFYLHAGLLERACCSFRQNEGAITAFPIAQTIDNDPSGFLTTNIISITDGQIVLDSDKFNSGFRPSVEVKNSVSRVGTSIQHPLLRSLTAGLKLQIAQAKEMEEISKFSSEIEDETKRIIEQGKELSDMLMQEEGEVFSLEEQILSLYLFQMCNFYDSEYVKTHAILLKNNISMAKLKEITRSIMEDK
jgi:F-type H+-transporting ATPase subunit alpha